MKIAFVLDDSLDKLDGVQQYVLTLGKWLTEHDHEVHYLTGETKRSDIPNVHSLSHNVVVRFNQNRLSTPLPADKAKIRRLLHDEAYDVLHVQMPYSPFMAGRIVQAAPMSTAVIGTFHIFPASWFEKFASRCLRLLIRSSLNRFDAVLSVSEPAADFAQASLGISSSVVPNMVALTNLQKPKLHSKYNDGKTNIVFMGRLVRRKGCMHLLHAVERLAKMPNISAKLRVIIAGEGPLKPSLMAFCDRTSLSSIVEFKGFVDEADKPSLLASAHLAVFPSTGGESFGIVLLEAMAAGSKVVIGGDNPGYRYVLDSRKDHLVNPKDTPAFAQLLMSYISNPAAQAESYAWQQERVKQFDVNVVGKAIVRHYQEIIAKKRISRDN